ncbi:MAG TPA: 4-alpha-glucanotransferase [Micromonosporaceae bacterium]|nr:4-alpha-glucanotransferase [Micromonosporaceae bacterium]
MDARIDRRLAALASAYGVATSYVDADRRRHTVRRETVVGVLSLLGVDAETPTAVDQSLRTVRARTDPARLPDTIVLRAGATRPLTSRTRLTLEDGTCRDVDELSADLPLGWHRLSYADRDGDRDGNRDADRDVTVVVVPRRLPPAPRTWGWMLQLYALRSQQSWGMGDLADLADFVLWTGTAAGFVLLNPLHAVSLQHPVPASPYSPSSRRFANPLYIRVEDTDEFRSADAALRARVRELRPDRTDLIDYDAVWTAKRAALELLFARAPRIDLDADPELAAFATYQALAERHGADWRRWSADLRRPNGTAVRAAREATKDRIAFHVWLQRTFERQFGAVADAAAAAGMPIGTVADLAVGIDPGGADAWLLGDVLAAGVRIGAPPDAFNQLGQDWGLAAWRPDRLAETGYAAYRDMLRRVLRGARGLRIDHVAGLWRLWWIPPGAGAADGTYVRYDPEAMLGILALEAERAGAVVIGEDLGTVPAAVTRGLRGRNMLSSTVLWFARDWNAPNDPFRTPGEWPARALASISTHDLPTAYGFLDAEHVRVRDGLNLLVGSADDELANADRDREQLLAMLRDAGLLGVAVPGRERPAPEETVAAMHAALAVSPSRLVAASLYDALGEIRQPNVPGTTDEYPNWRLPLPLTLEQIERDPRVAGVASLLADARPRRLADTRPRRLADGWPRRAQRRGTRHVPPPDTVGPSD